MAEFLNQQVKKVVKAKRNYKRYLALLLCLSMLVGLGTVAALTQKGEALTHKKKVLDCSFTPATGEGYAGYVAHVHNDDCYDAKGQLLCTLPEIPAHYHTDACWETVKETICGLEESAGHVHTEDCYARGEELVCGLAETEGHTHSDDCYAWYTDLTCGEVEYPEHWHGDDCYSWTTELICGLEEGEEHTHDENCYGPVRGELICGQTEGPGHAHDDSCYGPVRGELICGLAEVEPHTHSDACHPLTDELICGLEEGAGAHTHDESCWHEVKKAVCGFEGIHIHNESCYDAAGNLVCGQMQLEAHVHGEECFKWVDMTPEEIAALDEEEQDDVNDEAYTWVPAGDPNAGVETWNDWNNMFLNLELSGNWSEDLLAVARTQLGYGESAANYAISSTGGVKGYTRYGAWYGIPYGDWCAMFASFCIRWAGIPEENMPVDCNCSHWINQLAQLGMYASAENYNPKPGDLVFYDFNYDDIADHVGIVAAADLENDALVTIEGNRTDFVETFSLRYSEARVMGYGLLPVNPNPDGEPVILFPAQHFEDTVGDVTVTVEAPEGAFPPDTRMELKLVEDESILAAAAAAVASDDVGETRAVDITFYHGEEEIEPKIPIQVTMSSAVVGAAKDPAVVHIDNTGAAKVVEGAETNENDLSFSADSFSVYVFLEKLTTDFLASDGTTYSVIVNYDTRAEIPADASLRVREFAEDSGEYDYARRAVLADKKEKGEWVDLESFHVAALDISILDGEGKEIEPKAPVQVEIKIKQLPGVEDLSEIARVLEIQHHVETEQGVVLETVFSGGTDAAFVQKADADIAANGTAVNPYSVSDADFANPFEIDFLGVGFETEVFSTFTITWRDGDRSAIVHYGYMNGNTFVEFPNGTPSLPSNLDQNDGYAFLIRDVEGYTFSKSTLSSAGGTEISPLLRYSNNNWQSTQNSGGNWSTVNGQNIYVVYEPKTEPTYGGTPKVVETPTENPVAPEILKESESNHDGTNTLSLSIRSDTVPLEVEKLADVIVVFDISRSMINNNMGDVTRLAAAKQAVNALAADLLEKTNSKGEKLVRMGLVTFSTSAQVAVQLGSEESLDYDAFEAVVNGLNADGGTNWEKALYLANSQAVDPERATFVIFVTDGDPTFRMSRGDLTDGQVKSDTYNAGNNNPYQYYRDNHVFGQGNDDTQGYNYAKALIEAQDIVSHKKALYTIGVSNDVSKLDGFAESAGAAGHYTATDTSDLEQAFADIQAAITAYLGWGNIKMNDGITDLSNTVMEKSSLLGVDDDFTYWKAPAPENWDQMTAEQKQAYEPAESDFVEWDPTTEHCLPASYDTGNGAVQWNTGPDFFPEAGATYKVNFTVWPSQEAYDILANLENGTVRYEDLDDDVKAQIVKSGDSYTLKTNTEDAYTTYNTARKSATGVVITGDPVTIEFNEVEPMPLEPETMTVKKGWEYNINPSHAEAMQLHFRLKVDGKYYQNDGTFAPTTENAKDLPVSQATGWINTIKIAPGIVKFDANGKANVLETGHQYVLEEYGIAWSGEDYTYAYEFNSQTVRPMFLTSVNPAVDGVLTYLIKVDDNNPAPTGAATYTIDNELYYAETGTGAQGVLTGTNSRKAELDITKIVDGGAYLTETQANNETFTYRVTLTVPADADTSGITAYEYVPRYNDAPASNRYTIYGYRSVDTGAMQGIATDYSRFLDKIYGAYTVTTPGGPNATLNHVFVENADGSKTATIDITLKQLEILRFTNLPTGTQYTITEVYANKRQADPARNADAVPSYDVPSNLEEQGYTVSNIVTKNGSPSVSGNTVSGVIEDPDVRYYNQFTNTLNKNVEARLNVTKHLDGYEWSGERYYFTLTPGAAVYDDGSTTGTSPMPVNNTIYLSQASGSADRSYYFSNVRFVKPGTYTYTITEEGAGTIVDGVKRGEAETLKVRVVLDENGSLVVESITADPNTERTTFTAATETAVASSNTTVTNTLVTAKIELLKIGNDNETNVLPNAEFKMYSDANCTEQITQDSAGVGYGTATTDEEGHVSYDGVIKTGADGKASLGTLTPGNYYLKETKAPAGYELLNEIITITVNTDGKVTYSQPSYSKSQSEWPKQDETTGVYTIAVNNTSGSELPRTGGMGVMPFTVGGLALTLCALALLLEARRRQRRRGDADP